MAAPVPMYPPVGGTVAACVSKVELRVECKNLKKKDVTSKSDPCGVLYLQQSDKSWAEIARTENAENTLDPKFAQCFSLDYRFEEVQNVKICVYDVDNETTSLKDDDFLGKIECTLAQIVSGSPYTKPLLGKDGKPEGQSIIIVRAEEVKGRNDNIYLHFRADKLDKKDTFSKSDPYLEISRILEDGTTQVIHRTEVVKNDLNPVWRPFTLPLQTICQGDYNRVVRFEIFDWDKDGSHDLIGSFKSNVNEMLGAGKGKELSWPVIHEKKRDEKLAKKKQYTNSGVAFLSTCSIIPEYTFLDFIFGGMQINLTIGIDFTASNGDPRDPRSLHFINPEQPNEYIQAIAAVGAVAQDYDTDKLFPVLGFGAVIPPDTNTTHHEFAVNFNMNNPFCAGIPGVLDAYKNCIMQVSLSGPTYAAPIINHVARFAAQAQTEEPQKGAASYFVLLLLTDGALSDMDRTQEAIVKATNLPMSIIIVGVGSADFTSMNRLDGDDGVLKCPFSGQKAQRDIVQFVPFRDFKMKSPAELARHVLAEVPRQVTSYFKKQGLSPRRPPVMQ